MRRGFLTLMRHENHRFMRLALQTIFPPMVTTALYIAVFGYSLGAHIHTVHGVAYTAFIVPGLIMMAVVNNSYANSSSSMFMSKMEKSIENFLILPVTPAELVGAFIIGGMLRGVTVGVVVTGVAWLMVGYVMDSFFWTGVLMLLVCALFSAFGIINAQLARNWDQLSVMTNFVLTPLIFLGGVFYSVDMLPGWARLLSHLNPLFYIINAFRHSILGVTDVAFALSFSVIAVATAGMLVLSLWLFRSGKGLLV